MKWHFQFTPNDAYDYDSVQVPVLADMNWRGSRRKLMLWANRNGFFYVLDRDERRVPARQPVREGELGERPRRAAAGRSRRRSPPAQPTWPGIQGGTNWYSPSYSPRTGLFYVSAWEGLRLDLPAASRSSTRRVALRRRRRQPSRRCRAPGVASAARPINNWTEALGHGAVIAIDPRTGEQQWSVPIADVSTSGILTTASDVLFTGSRDGYFYVLDARDGKQLWRTTLGGAGANGPITYSVGGAQYVAVSSGNGLFVFGLRR